MMVGPVVIGYIPVCVVGALIYLLGYELLKEALYDTWGRLRKVEYTTIVIIVVTMGAVDFVAGIGVGIILACLSFVVEAGRTPVVEGIYTGSVARSTVMRHPKQQEFLKHVGDQIYIIKLQGSLFFGSIGGVEKVIKNLFEEEKFSLNPISYLIIDMKGVISLDFSAAEGFRRILNLTNSFKTQLIISSVSEDDDITQGLRDAGLFDNGTNSPIELFSSLNYALE
ncbi:putative vacuolar membrane protein, partial [Candida tropicalis]